MEIDLELQHPSHHRSLPLQDVKEPQLFREQFPYTSICRTEFDDVVLAPHPADQLCITDTTFRDGQQARPPYTVSQVAKIFDFLHRLGGKTGLITASEFFMYSERDRKCIDACRARGYRFPRITGWIRANKNDLQLARDMEFSEVGMLTSVSDYHIFLKLGKTREQAMNDYFARIMARLTPEQLAQANAVKDALLAAIEAENAAMKTDLKGEPPHDENF